MDTTTTISPQRYARCGDLLYLMIIIAGIIGELMIRASSPNYRTRCGCWSKA